MAGKKPQNTQASHQFLQSATLIPPQQVEVQPQQTSRRKHCLKNESAEPLYPERSADVVLNHLACFLHKFPIGHTGRASRFAATAVEASGDVLDETLGNRDDTVLLGAHQVNAATRRIGFAAQLNVRG